MKTIVSLSIATLIACSTAFADSYEFSDFVVNPEGVAEVSVYINLDAAMKNKATSVLISAPKGFAFNTRTEWDEIEEEYVTVPDVDMLFPAGLSDPGLSENGLFLSTVASTSKKGKIPYATFRVTAFSDAENGVFTTSKDRIGGVAVASTSFKVDVLKDLTISPSGYSTFSACAPVAVSGGTICTGVLNGDVVTVTEEAGTIVPTNTGVIIKGEPGAKVTLAPADEEGTIGENSLVSSKEAKELTSSFMALTRETDETPVFLLWDGSAVPDNKAFLPWNGNNAPVRIDFGGNSIESVNAERNIGINYNLMGQLVKAQKGLVIENGKKVINL